MAIWSGLGINADYPFKGVSTYLTVNTTVSPPFVPLITNNFPRVRTISHMNDLNAPPSVYDTAHRYWLGLLIAANPSIYAMYGGSPDIGFYPGMYSAYVTYISNNATWAQANGVSLFCVGNEFEINGAHSDNPPLMSSQTRASNVVTVSATAHGLTTGDLIMVKSSTPSSFNIADSEGSPSSTAVTVVDANTFTYPNNGVDQSASTPGKFNWSYAQVVIQWKKLVTICQGIFTNGPCCYSVSQGHEDAIVNVGLAGQGVNLSNFLIGFNFYGD